MTDKARKTRNDIKQIIDEMTDEKIEMIFAYIKGLSTGIDLMETQAGQKTV